MKILELELENIRNFKNLKLDLNNPLVVICGKNAEGKTNLLESIYFLTLTKPLRKGRERNIIKKGGEGGRIKGAFKTDDNRALEIEFILGLKKTGKVDKVPSKMKEIMGKAKAILFTAEDLNIIESPPKKRRFLNILLSLLDKKYFFNLLEYQQVLKRRNRVLIFLKAKKGRKEELGFWDESLSILGADIIKKRKEAVSKINELLKDSLFFKTSPLVLKYKPQAYSSCEILKKLESELERDIAIGQTTVGPHRDFIRFEANNMDLEFFGSRGEKRAAIIELKKAEAEMIKGETKAVPILLLDDVFSELDLENRKNVLKFIKDQQTIITTTNPEHLGAEIKKAKVYKVENNTVIAEQTQNKTQNKNAKPRVAY